jgi:hypothetical protein
MLQIYDAACAAGQHTRPTLDGGVLATVYDAWCGVASTKSTADAKQFRDVDGRRLRHIYLDAKRYIEKGGYLAVAYHKPKQLNAASNTAAVAKI